MWNPFERLRQRRARRRWVPQPRRSRTGTTGKIALFLVLVILVVGMILEVRARTGEGQLLEYADASAVPALELIVNAGRSHRLLFLGDVRGAAAPKRLAADAIDTLATTVGLDAVAIGVDPELQPWIDRYLDSSPEDVSLLLSRPRLLRDADGTANAMLEVFRRVHALNERLGADRRIRIVAADLPGWPLERAVSPGQATTRFAQRDEHMFEIVNSRILQRSPRARILFFVDGLHVLNAEAAIQSGGADPARIPLLARRFQQAYPRETFSILVDAAVARSVVPEVAGYRGTAALPVLRDNPVGETERLALRSAPALDFTDDMLRIETRPGISLQVLPRDAPLADLIDAYIFLRN